MAYKGQWLHINICAWNMFSTYVSYDECSVVKKNRVEMQKSCSKVMQTGNVQLTAIIASYCTNLHIKDFHITV